MAAPVLLPKHSTLVTAVEVASAEAGCVMVTLFEEVQPFASVTVTVLAPAFKPVMTEAVWAVDHK